jgi:DNA-binding FrmR family transcriptional regulator
MQPMGHIAKSPTKVLGRVRRIKGQIEGIERALVGGKDCAEILRQIAAVRGAVNGLMAKVLEDHIEMHVANPAIKRQAMRDQGARELVEVLRTYLK